MPAPDGLHFSDRVLEYQIAHLLNERCASHGVSDLEASPGLICRGQDSRCRLQGVCHGFFQVDGDACFQQLRRHVAMGGVRRGDEGRSQPQFDEFTHRADDGKGLGILAQEFGASGACGRIRVTSGDDSGAVLIGLDVRGEPRARAQSHDPHSEGLGDVHGHSTGLCCVLCFPLPVEGEHVVDPLRCYRNRASGA